MKKCFLFVVILFHGLASYCQEIVISSGINFTHYNYLNSKGQRNDLIQDSSGFSYQIGMFNDLEDCNCDMYRFSYSGSLVINEFNAKGTNTSYRWDTQFYGADVAGYYSFFPEENFNVLLKLGLNFSGLLNGNQLLLNDNYDLSNYSEFKGLWMAPSFGFQLKTKFSDYIYFFAGYDFMRSYNVSNKGPEYLSFSTNQILIGFTFPLTIY